MDNQIQELQQKKEEITLELRKLESEKKFRGNVLMRADTDFICFLDDIIEFRYKNGIDKKPLSKPKLTRLISKHRGLREDLKHYVFEKE